MPPAADPGRPWRVYPTAQNSGGKARADALTVRTLLGNCSTQDRTPLFNA